MDVTFSPRYPGLRQDAVVVKNEAGDLLATAFLHGVGVGPQAALVPGMLTSPPSVIGNMAFDYIRADSAGNLFVAGHSSVKKIELATNKVTTIAGTETAGYSGDGGPAAQAQLDSPGGLAIDGAGNVYISDTNNDVVRRVDAVTGIITTVAGNGTCALPSSGVPATQAALCAPTALVLDANGNLYVDVRYGTVVQDVHQNSDIITTVAGNGTYGYTGDGGPATEAQLGNPTGLALDSDGNVFISDWSHCVVRKVNAVSGIITTVAGDGTCIADTGDGGPAAAAALWGADAIALDSANNLYIATGTAASPVGLNLVRKVDFATGIISTIAGGGPQMTNGNFSVPATTARLIYLSDLSIDATGTLYIAWDGMLSVVSPSSSAINFGSVPVLQTSPIQNVSIANIGNSALGISSLGLSGSNASDFTLQTACGSSLAAGDSCPLSVSFKPPNGGVRLASVAIQSSDSNSPRVIALTGVGGAAPVGILTPGVLTFAEHVRLGSTLDAKIELTNPSSTALPVSATSITGVDASDFQAFNGCGTLVSPGATCTVYVYFTPSRPGSRTATLQITTGSGTLSATLSGFATARPSDLNADGVSDLIIWRPSNGTWYLAPGNSSAFVSRQWGFPDDVPLTGDFDGDGKPDIVIWRPWNGVWYIRPSSNPDQPTSQQWGANGDIPVTGDFDGDGKLDIAVWRPSNGTWYVLPSGSPNQPFMQQWGLPGDIPIVGDFDFDGRSDFAVWRPSDGTWYVIPSSRPDQPMVTQWGMEGDIPVAADFAGVGVTNFAVWRPWNGTWYIMPIFNSQNIVVQQWGFSGDVPVPGDYDGDGKVDFAVWRPSNGNWYILSSATGQVQVRQWGAAGDIPK